MVEGAVPMITVFNRKELLVTYSMELQSKARNILNEWGIDYIVDTAGTAARNIGLGPIGVDRFGTNPSFSCQYKIYVNRKDYEKARAALAGKL